MSQPAKAYTQATRHAWACTLFVLPMLIAYEIGVWSLDVTATESLRNGADCWLRWLLTQIGLVQSFWPGLFLATGLLVWSFTCWQSRPDDIPNVWMGMVVESASYALGLWVLSLALGPLLDYLQVPLRTTAEVEPGMQMLVAYLGAGIYEEAVFRLLAFTLMCQVFLLGDVPDPFSTIFAVAASALLFSAAHHVGPVGEPFDGFVFLFRTLAGIYFALLYRFRGFGIAVGTHSFYDIFVGIILTSS